MKVKIDLLFLATALLIFLLGLLNLYSASYNFGTNYLLKQVVWLIFSFGIGWMIYKMETRKLLNCSYLLYLASLLLLILVLLLPSKGAHRWLRFGFLNFQPSQLMKFSLPFFLVWTFYHQEFNSLGAIFLPLLATAIPAFLIAQEPDLGGALMLFPALITFFILKRIPFRKILPWLFLAIVLLPLLYTNLEDYQKRRLLAFWNSDYDPLGVGYTLLESKIAIGSGRIFGRGWLQGIQGQLRFLPESHTDFVFPVFAEEWGFLGALILLLLYWTMLTRMKTIILGLPDDLLRALLWLLLVTFSLQIVINIGMSMGIFPIVGLPLPLFSYGGSDLIVTVSILAIFLRCSGRK